MAEANKKMRAGQGVRLCDLTADANTGFGCFEDLHLYANANEFAKAVDRATRQYYGTAFSAFLDQLMPARPGLAERLREAIRRFERDFLSERASGQARRVAARFALIGLAGEMATQFNVTGWQQGEALAAAATCFKFWLEHRGGEGNQEERAMLAQVREFFERWVEGRFADWNRPITKDDHVPRIINKAGFRRHDPDSDATEWFVYPHIFRN